MSEDFIALLEVELDKATYNQADELMKKLSEKKVLQLDTKEARDKLANINKQLDNVSRKIDKINGKKLDFGVGKTRNPSMPSIGIDAKQVQKITDAFDRLSTSIEEIQKSIGTLDDTSSMQSLISVANQIGSAFAEMEDDIRQAAAAMKSFDGLKLNVNLGSNKKNPVAAAAQYGRKVRNETIPELQSYVTAIKNALKAEGLDEFNYFQERIERVFDKNGELIGTSIQHFDNETRARLNELNNNWRKAFSNLGKDASLEEQMQHYARQIDMLKELADIRKIDLSSIVSQFDDARTIIKNTTSMLDDAVGDSGKSTEKLKNLFGGIDTDGMRDVLAPLSETASEIKSIIEKISNNIDLSKINQQLTDLTSNLTRIESILNGFGGQLQLPALAQSFTDLANAINSAMNACNNIQNTVGNSNNAMSQMSNVTIDASQHANALAEAMNGLNINQAEINEATQRLKDMDITVLTVTRHIRDLANGGQAVDFTIRGVDQHGQAVTATQKYRRTLGKDGSYTDTMIQDLRIAQTVGRIVEETEKLRANRNSFGLDIDIWSKENTDAARAFATQLSDIQNRLQDCDSQTLTHLKAEFDEVKKRAQFEGFLSDSTLESDSNRIEKSLQKIATQSEETRNALSRYGTAQQALDRLDSNSTTQQRVDVIREYLDALKQLENQIQKNIQAEKQQKDATKQENAIAKLEVDKRAFSAGIDVWTSKNGKAAEHFRSEIERIRLELQNADAQGLAKLKVELTEVKRKAEAAGLTVKSFGQEIKDLLNKAAGYFTLDFVVDRAVDSIREMYQQVLEIDTAMTDLLKVTDETSQRYQQFMKNASGTAKELGRSMSGYITQTAEWAKTGYSMDESEQLAKISSIYANVGDVDDSTAVSDMVTAMKAYRIEASEAIRIVDTLNKLGNEFAVTAKGLGAGMANSASAMALSNTTFEQTMALLTGISEITQSPAEAGSFLKVASMRIRGKRYFKSYPLPRKWNLWCA